jgi:pSer/pThr/pTyr-binding forkhead associated (FHA) protein
MPEVLLHIWKLVLLGFIYLFFFRVLRAIWANLRTTTTPPRPVAPPHAARQRSPQENRSVSKLRVLEPREQAGRMYDLDDEITIGRAPGCKINVEDTYVSQLHARVFLRNGQAMIEDLGSTNGTYHNGKRVGAPAVLEKGDRIQVGRTVMEATK